MNPKTAGQWIEAYNFMQKINGFPPIAKRLISAKYYSAIKQAKPFKPAIKFPKGESPRSIKALKKEAWDAFSKYIRQRDADENGAVKCCTCENIRHWKGMDAGHFVSRIYESTLFDPMNVHAQCGGCNMPPNNGRPIAYAVFLDRTYGAGTVEKITARAKREILFRPALEAIIKQYKEQTKCPPVP